MQPGTQDITVDDKDTVVLPAGDYHKIKLNKGDSGEPTVLELSGSYQLDKLELDKHSHVVCAAPCEIFIKDRLDAGEKTRDAQIRPAQEF